MRRARPTPQSLPILLCFLWKSRGRTWDLKSSAKEVPSNAILEQKVGVFYTVSERKMIINSKSSHPRGSYVSFFKNIYFFSFRFKCTLSFSLHKCGSVFMSLFICFWPVVANYQQHAVVCPQWKLLPEQAQAKYYEEAERQRLLYRQQHPEWYYGENYVSMPCSHTMTASFLLLFMSASQVSLLTCKIFFVLFCS